MQKIGVFGVFAAVLAMAVAAPALADNQSSMVDMKMNSRFGGPGVYTGAPALGVTLAVVEAGGGPANYQTTTLLQTLAGSAFKPEVAKLTATYGAAQVGQFIKTFDFIIGDALHYVTVDHVALPAQPAVDPKDGKALSGALWGASSIGGGKHSVEVGLDHLVGHSLHVQIMDDVDKKFGAGADAQYHVILGTALADLAGAYKL